MRRRRHFDRPLWVTEAAIPLGGALLIASLVAGGALWLKAIQPPLAQRAYPAEWSCSRSGCVRQYPPFGESGPPHVGASGAGPERLPRPNK